MKSTKEIKKTIDINSYIVLEILECLKYLAIPENLKFKLNNITLDLENLLFQPLDNYDMVNQKWECTTKYELFIPKSKGIKI